MRDISTWAPVQLSAGVHFSKQASTRQLVSANLILRSVRSTLTTTFLISNGILKFNTEIVPQIHSQMFIHFCSKKSGKVLFQTQPIRNLKSKYDEHGVT